MLNEEKIPIIKFVASQSYVKQLDKYCYTLFKIEFGTRYDARIVNLINPDDMDGNFVYNCFVNLINYPKSISKEYKFVFTFDETIKEGRSLISLININNKFHVPIRVVEFEEYDFWKPFYYWCLGQGIIYEDKS